MLLILSIPATRQACASPKMGSSITPAVIPARVPPNRSQKYKIPAVSPIFALFMRYILLASGNCSPTNKPEKKEIETKDNKDRLSCGDFRKNNARIQENTITTPSILINARIWFLIFRSRLIIQMLPQEIPAIDRLTKRPIA